MFTIAQSSHWRVTADPLQWIVEHQTGGRWRPASFVHTTKAILARCLMEKGCAADTAAEVLAGCPERFSEADPCRAMGAAVLSS